MSVPASSLSTSITNAVRREVKIPRAELLQLAAVNDSFYCHHFFPKTFRQGTPTFHQVFWDAFNDDTKDFFAAEMFRGSAKTTLTKVGISKRVAFGILSQILLVAISQAKAIKSLIWLRKQVEQNDKWTSTFMLQKGSKWTDDWIEIVHVPLGITINIVAVGMTGAIRGLNIDDYRPDAILCDDICDDENMGTDEQIEKTNELFFGAIVPALAPKSEAPQRKLMLLQTPINKRDIITLTHSDPTFSTVKQPKLVENELGELVSAWPERFPTAECLQEKEDYARRNKMHIYLREFACKIVSRETAPLKEEWLREYTTLPTNLQYYVGIDPASRKKKKHIHKSACVLIGVDVRLANTYLVKYKTQQGMNPDEIWEWLLHVHTVYRPKVLGVETIAYQDMLAWYIQQKMIAEQTFFRIQEVQDRRSKPDRIEQAFSGIGSQGRFFVHASHTEFKTGWIEWDGSSDWDLGDAGAQAVTIANPYLLAGQGGDGDDETGLSPDESEYPELQLEGGCP